jgi:transcriptional regulator with XRE-family HTH domain
MTPYERAKETAKKQGLSLQTVATRAGMGINSVYRWKDTTPASDKLQAVADVLHVSVDYLLGNTDDPNPAPKAGKSQPVDLADRTIPMTFEGKPIPDSDRDIIDAILRRNGLNER